MTGETVTTRAKTEARALKMLREGWSAAQVSRDTGLSLDELHRLRRDFPSTSSNPAPRCPQTRCGLPQVGAGHPRKGWVQVKVAGEQHKLWFCGWPCVSRHAFHQHRLEATS